MVAATSADTAREEIKTLAEQRYCMAVGKGSALDNLLTAAVQEIGG
ncbi:hypothetical protein CPter91_0332 [Collimonas pratensis]|uniref:Uncharacterized protein n=1 Tax=Collimonas pratensis TaxID=279113 RepID=A0A127PY63_9BURK|nr:hypothetical protein CPter91_0332 [Collimonas pratensis]